MGYSGWIRNANTISFSKFENLLKYSSKTALAGSETLELYKNKVYIPNSENENSIFYFVREPGIKNIKSFSSEQEYIDYLKFMEGSVKMLKITNFCYEGILILDGTFTIPVKHDDVIKVKIGDDKVKTLQQTPRNIQ